MTSKARNVADKPPPYNIFYFKDTICSHAFRILPETQAIMDVHWLRFFVQ